MNVPTIEEVVSYAAELGVTPTVGATYHAHGEQTNWTMRDGQKVRDWRTCFRKWIERMQGQPGFEIVLHDRPKQVRSNGSNAESERKQRQKEHQTFAIIKKGRESQASNDRIIAVLRTRGLVWPDYADIRFARPSSITIES